MLIQAFLKTNINNTKQRLLITDHINNIYINTLFRVIDYVRI